MTSVKDCNKKRLQQTITTGFAKKASRDHENLLERHPCSERTKFRLHRISLPYTREGTRLFGRSVIRLHAGRVRERERERAVGCGCVVRGEFVTLCSLRPSVMRQLALQLYRLFQTLP